LLNASPFSVVHVSENEVILDFALPDYELKEIEHEGNLYHRITGSFTHFHSLEGYPLIPYFSEIVGIPVDGGITLSIENIVQKTQRGVTIYPTEKLVIGSETSSGNSVTIVEQPSGSEPEEIDYIFYRNRNAYNSSENYPLNILEEGYSGFASDRRYASFRLNPFRYNAASSSLSVISEATIRITIQGDKSVSRDFIPGRSYIDRLGELFFINDEQSRYWRKTRDYNPDYTPLRSFGISEIQFIVDSEGIYRVTYSDIQDIINLWEEELEYQVDLDLDSLDPRYLQLENKENVVPVHFIGERDGSFDPGDYFEFFGDRHYGKEGYYDTYTSENVYTLKLVDQWGARMAVENGGIRETNPANYILPVSYEQTVHFEEQGSGLHFTLGNYATAPREDLWFWKRIFAPDLDVTPFHLEYPEQTHLRGFEAAACLVGLTYITDTTVPDHRARVRINSSFINDHSWFGQSEKIFSNTSPLPNLYLNHGENYLYIDLPGDTPSGHAEIVLFDYLTLKYWREYKTDSDYIRFSRPSNRPLGLYQFELDNFSTDQISIYKINSGFIENLQIEPFSETGGAPYKVTFQNQIVADNIEFIALTEDQKKSPKEIRPRIPSELKNPDNTADYIIITVRDFIAEEGTQLLKNIWQNRGADVKLVDIQNIFDEFNNGIRSADAIKDFLTYAYHNWSIPMTHVLLLGKGIFDERDFSVHRNINHIPYKNIWTDRVGATPSDNWYACIVGDDPAPDINISRITLWERDQIMPVAEKSLHYLENPNYNDLWQSTITLAAGGKITDAEDIFAQLSEELRDLWIPDDFNVVRVYTNTQPPTPPQYLGGTFKLKNTWDAGTYFVQFFGHGGGRIWADYNLLNNNDIVTLNNNNYPFVLSLSCYPADFSRPGAGSIGETMILIPDRGAIAHYGTSGLSYTYSNVSMANHLNESIYHRNLGSFGDITSYAKTKFSASGGTSSAYLAMTHGAIMFGDPMIGFDLPQDRVHIELSQYNITEGDTLHITVDMGEDIQYARFLIQNEDEITQNIPFDIPLENGIFQASYVIPNIPQNIYRRLVKVYGYGSERQVLGMTNFTVGQTAVVDNVTIPAEITEHDPVHIAARFFDETGIQSVLARSGSQERTMVYDPEEDRYITTEPFPASNPNPNPRQYYFIITTGANQTVTSPTFTYRVLGPDLTITEMEFASFDNQPAIKLQAKNMGDLKSPETIIRLIKRVDDIDTVLSETDVPEILPLENNWVYIPIEPIQGSIRFIARINPDVDFAEHSLNNNSITSPQYTLNMFYAGVNSVTEYSLDGNLKFEIPAGLLSEETIFYINSEPFKEPLNQPDINTIALSNNSYSRTYELGLFDKSVLPDTLGTLPDDKTIRLTIDYNPSNPDNMEWEDENSFAFYRWIDHYDKWIHQGGFTSTVDNHVYQDLKRLGTYTILRNNDRRTPTVTANVQDQEFTYGGYISGTGIISFTLADANGIDIFDKDIELFLNGVPVDERDFTIAANPGNLTSIPIKHQLNLDDGNYTLSLSCADVNGNFQSHDINFVVNTRFEVLNLANYPNPVVTTTIDPANQNRTRFTYVLTDDADEVTIKVYTVSGRLVKTFHNLPSGIGYHEYPRTVLGWDCRDDKGYYLANGVYFYKIIARKGNKTAEKTQKMAITR
jgi:hypothetical protein